MTKISGERFRCYIKLIFSLIMKYNVDIKKKDSYDNIEYSGGTTIFEGIAKTSQKELAPDSMTVSAGHAEKKKNENNENAKATEIKQNKRKKKSKKTLPLRTF